MLRPSLLLVAATLPAATFAIEFQSPEEIIKDKEATQLLTVRRINYFFNQYPYASDLEHKGQKDYWSSPAEFLEDGKGDCEDYAFVKYHYLRKYGIPASKLRFYTVLLDERYPHMVLAYFHQPDEPPYILDSASYRAIKADIRIDLTTIYSFNENQMWISPSFTKDTAKSPVNIRKYRETMDRQHLRQNKD